MSLPENGRDLEAQDHHQGLIEGGNASMNADFTSHEDSQTLTTLIPSPPPDGFENPVNEANMMFTPGYSGIGFIISLPEPYLKFRRFSEGFFHTDGIAHQLGIQGLRLTPQKPALEPILRKSSRLINKSLSKQDESDLRTN